MPQTKAHIAATGRYEAKAYDKILLRIRKDGKITKETISNAAARIGSSLNAYIMEAVREKMEREQ